MAYGEGATVMTPEANERTGSRPKQPAKPWVFRLWTAPGARKLFRGRRPTGGRRRVVPVGGELVVVETKPGAFGEPWQAGYRAG